MPDDIRIVVLEGPLSSGITGILVEGGYSVTHADASQLLPKAEGAALVVLDVLAPGMDLEGLSELEQRVEAPVLVIVPALDTGQRVAAIRAPFEPDTLLEQVQRLLTEAPPSTLSRWASW